jgi:hypothetical protein
MYIDLYRLSCCPPVHAGVLLEAPTLRDDPHLLHSSVLRVGLFFPCAMCLQNSAPDLLPAALQLMSMVQFEYDVTYPDHNKVLLTQRAAAVGIATAGSFDRPPPSSLKPLSSDQKEVEQAFLHFIAVGPGRQNYVVTELRYCAVTPPDVFFFDAWMYARNKNFCSYELKGYDHGLELVRKTHVSCNAICKRLKLAPL